MTRRKLDAYYTLAPMVKALTARVNITGQVLEPCCGAGVISDVFPGCLTNDIDPDVPALWHEDATLPGFWEVFKPQPFEFIQRVDWVVTNPPFNQAFPILEHAWEHARRGVAMLVRISFEEPTRDRSVWLAENALYLSDELIFGLPRPRFRINEINPKTGKKYGSDNVTTKWLVWRKDHHGQGTRKHYVTNWK